MTDDELAVAVPGPWFRIVRFDAGMDRLNLLVRNSAFDQCTPNSIGDGDDPMARPCVFQAMHPGMSRLKRDMARHHAAYRSPQCSPIRDVLCPPAMGMDDIGIAQSEFPGREAFRLCAFRQRARCGTHDGL